MKKFYAFLVIIILIGGCKNSVETPIPPSNDDIIFEDMAKELSEDFPEDFEFVFSYGFSQATNHDSIDTINNTITKDLILDGVGSGTIDFDSEFLEEVYRILYDGNISRYPEEFKPPYKDNPEPDIEVSCTPNMVYKLYILANGEEFILHWNNNNCSETVNAKNLERNLEKIIILIKELNEYKELGEPNGVYL